MDFEHLIMNMGGSIRKETLEGRTHLVAPTAMLTEGVHVGNAGKLYYPPDVISANITAWNSKPVIVYHPPSGDTACSPEIINKQKVGILLNTRWDGKLRSEAWIDEQRMDAVDIRIRQFLESGEVMEVSTGMTAMKEMASGVWNEEAYDGVIKMIAPDHLALLPDRIGACSVKDGAGLLVMNDASHQETYEQLQKLLDVRYGRSVDTWVTDVYPSHFIYQVSGDGLFVLSYTDKDGVITISNDPPERVRRHALYKTDAGVVINNTDSSEEDETMTKSKIVDALIQNAATQWGEDHRDNLMKLDESTLKLMEPVANTEDPPTKEEKPTTKTKETPPVITEPTVQNQELSFEDFLKVAPPEFVDVFNEGKTAREEKRKGFIKTIVANANNPFTEDFLNTKSTDELRGLASLAGTKESQQNVQNSGGVPMFIGQAGSFSLPVHNEGSAEEEALGIPDWN